MGTELEFKMTEIKAEVRILKDNILEYKEIISEMEEEGESYDQINRMELLVQKAHGEISDLMEEAENLQVAIWNEESASIQRHTDKIHVRGW